MRQIILLAPAEAVSSEGAGEICRFVAGALLLSHGARRDIKLDLVFDPEGCMSFDSASMRNVRPDEQSLSGILRAGLRRLREGGGGRIMQGIGIRRTKLKELLEGTKGERLYFKAGGGRSSRFNEDLVGFFQYPQLEGEVEGELMKMGFQGMNLGRCRLSLDQAVVVLHNRADRQQVRR